MAKQKIVQLMEDDHYCWLMQCLSNRLWTKPLHMLWGTRETIFCVWLNICLRWFEWINKHALGWKSSSKKRQILCVSFMFCDSFMYADNHNFYMAATWNFCKVIWINLLAGKINHQSPFYLHHWLYIDSLTPRPFSLIFCRSWYLLWTVERWYIHWSLLR